MAYAVFGARPNSHPFQERHISLKEPVKIGRSVAKSKPATGNLVFDCKVLSRNHAVLWYENGKFFLQDTKSSNGTYVNNVQLGRGGDDSDPLEVKSGDYVQFGVDVVENSRKVTHGCIVATVTLFHPDGREASSTPDDVAGGLLPLMNIENNVQAHEFWQLSQYLQDARHREQMLEQKLATLQRMIANSQAASDETWQAFIKEDRLLSRLDIIESQIEYVTKDMTDEDARHELLNLFDDKQTYENNAKETLRKVLQEKIEALQKLTGVERSLSNSEDESAHLRSVYEKSQDELKELMDRHRQRWNEMQQLQEQVIASEKRHQSFEESANKDKENLKKALVEAEKRGSLLAVQVESLQAECDFTKEQLTAIKDKLEKQHDESRDFDFDDEDDPSLTQKRVPKPKAPSLEENDISVIEVKTEEKSTHEMNGRLEDTSRLEDTPRDLKESRKDISRLTQSIEDDLQSNGDTYISDDFKDLSEESCDILGMQLGLFTQLQEHLLDMKDSVLDVLEVLARKIGKDETDYTNRLDSPSGNSMSLVIPISTSLEEQVQYYQKALENSCKQAKFLRDELIKVVELAEEPSTDQEKCLQGKLRNMTDKYEEKFEEVESLTEELSETQSEVCDVKKQIIKLQDQLLVEQEARRTHEALAATLEKRLQELHKHLEIEKIEKEHEHIAVVSARTSAAKMQKQAADNAEQAGRGKVELSALSEEHEMQKMKMQLLKSEVKKLKQENTWLSSEKLRLASEYSSLKQNSLNRHEKFKHDQDSLIEEVKVNRKERSSSISEVCSLCEELELAQSEINNLNDRNRKDVALIDEQKSILMQLLLVLVIIFVAIGAAYLFDVINISSGNSPIFDPMTWTEIYHNLF